MNYRTIEKLSEKDITEKIDKLLNEAKRYSFSILTTLTIYADLSNINSNDKNRLRIFLSDNQEIFKDENIYSIVEIYISLIKYKIIDYSAGNMSKLLNYMINKGGIDCFKGIYALLFNGCLNDLNVQDKNNLIQFLKDKPKFLYEIKDDEESKITTFLELMKKIGIDYDFKNELEVLIKNLIDIDDFNQIYSLCRGGYLDVFDNSCKEKLSRYFEIKVKTYNSEDMESLLNFYILILDKNFDIDLTVLLTNFIHQHKDEKISYSSIILLQNILKLLLTKELKTNLDFETISILLGISFDSRNSLALIRLYNNKYKKNRLDYLSNINDINEYIHFLRTLFLNWKLSTFWEQTIVETCIFNKIIFLSPSEFTEFIKSTELYDKCLFEEDFKRIFDNLISLAQKKCCEETKMFGNKKCLYFNLHDQAFLHQICYAIEKLLNILVDEDYETIITFIKKIIGLSTGEEKIDYLLLELLEENKKKLKIDDVKKFYEECMKYRNEFLDSPMPGHEEMSIREYNDKIYSETQELKKFK